MSSQFDISAALRMAKASLMAYEPLQPGCLRFEAENHSVDLWICKGECVIAFRGTNDVRDWLADADVLRVKRIGCKVHRGFDHGERLLHYRLTNELPQCSRYWITGHSLGGALATLYAVRLADAGLNVAGLYTFGSPRVGCRCFAQHADYVLSDRHFRVVHGNDIVPRVPRPIRYRHCGQLCYLDRRDVVRFDPSFLSVEIDRLLGYRFDLVRDHFMESYFRSLYSVRNA
jgi:triacylglycerol lipase